MTKLYKLTTPDNKTRPGKDNECRWGENVTHSGTGKGDLCGPGYIHAYTDPLLAVLLNPLHGDYPNPNLWECEGEIAKHDGQLKVGCVTLTTVRQIELPKITTEQRAKFAILCAKQVCTDPAWNNWADKWLSGADRTAWAAWAAWAAGAAWAAAAEAPDIDLAAIAKAAITETVEVEDKSNANL